MRTLNKNIPKLIAMFAITKNLPLVTVLMATKRTKTPELILDCNLQKTLNDPLVVAIPNSDPVMKTEAATLESLYDNSKGKPPTATVEQVTAQRNICINLYNQNAGYIQGIARIASIDAGDVSVGEQVIIRCGYKVKRPKSPTVRRFKVIPSGVGAVNIITKAVAKRATYIRQYGVTPTKGVPPTVFAELLITSGTDIYVNNLKSATIYGFREATVLPTSRSTTSSKHVSAVKKMATPTVATKAHKVTFSDGAEHYNWGDWIYTVIM